MEVHEQMEQAEQAHHAGTSFEKRVAVTIAIVAVALAGISMLGHRKHNQVLQFQGESNRLQTEAAILHTQASNQWARYQAVNVRDHGYSYSGGLLKDMAEADPKLKPVFKSTIDKAAKQNAKYEPMLLDLEKTARSLDSTAEKKQIDSLHKVDESIHSHHQANELDKAHLVAEIGLVLCSIALLTKWKAFWFTGIIAGVTSIAIAAFAYTIPHEPHDPIAHTAEQHH
jgi:hypothetical protein